ITVNSVPNPAVDQEGPVVPRPRRTQGLEVIMLELYGQVQDAAAFLKADWHRTPKVGIILGTGLGKLAEEIACEASFEYESIPHFPRSTAESHRGRLVCGNLEGQIVMAMEGRFHMYEGYSLKQITLPVRVMRQMGCELLIVSNACGGMNSGYRCGDMMVIDDHINLMGDNPLIGINDDRLGPRFPDMSAPYDPDLIDRAQRLARSQDVVLHRGVFVAVSGPNLETRAEYRFLRAIGADVVGMSTVPEVIVAAHCGMRVIGFSIITDLCFPDSLQPANVREIIRVANETEPRLRRLVRGLLAGLAA
ncbi:MAG TPA: purine-nucleoside phosphorylase, partial [Pirellulaceae bacterium]